MIILIIGMSNNETLLDYFFLFRIADSFRLIVEFKSNLPLGLQTFSFQSLLKGTFSIRIAPGETID